MQSKQCINDIRAAANEPVKAQKRTQYGLKETFNPLLELSVDLYR